jgi:hypothetical protein
LFLEVNAVDQLLKDIRLLVDELNLKVGEKL